MDKPRVKPLVWLSEGFDQDADLVDSTFTYQIQEGNFWYAAEVSPTVCGTNEAAKAAAQADYEARILAALEAAPVSVPLGAVNALASYQQADEDGIMVLVSRQALEECLPALRALAGDEGER